MKASDAWLAQSKSDFEASGRVFVEDDCATYCQTISKCQQTVEKSVKGLVTALTEAGIWTTEVGWKHEVGKFATLFVLLHPTKKKAESAKDIMSSLRQFFSRSDIDSGIRQLDGLVPKRPAPGDPLQRNTEYPFHASDRSFLAPAETNIFTLKEVKHCQDIAERVFVLCTKAASALRRL